MENTICCWATINTVMPSSKFCKIGIVTGGGKVIVQHLTYVANDDTIHTLRRFCGLSQAPVGNGFSGPNMRALKGKKVIVRLPFNEAPDHILSFMAPESARGKDLPLHNNPDTEAMVADYNLPGGKARWRASKRERTAGARKAAPTKKERATIAALESTKGADEMVREMFDLREQKRDIEEREAVLRESILSTYREGEMCTPDGSMVVSIVAQTRLKNDKQAKEDQVEIDRKFESVADHALPPYAVRTIRIDLKAYMESSQEEKDIVGDLVRTHDCFTVKVRPTTSQEGETNG